MQKLKTLGSRITALAAVLMAGTIQLLDSILFGPAVYRKVCTNDVAWTYRMGAGFPGDVNRTHPVSILAGLQSATNPVRLYGDPAVIDGSTNTYRGIIAGDQSDATGIPVRGILVRPFPTQQTSGGMSAALGAGAPPSAGVIDLIREGYVMVKIPAGQSVVKGQLAYIWCTASTGAHVQGGFEAALDASDTVPTTNVRFMGPADASGNVEVEILAA